MRLKHSNKNKSTPNLGVICNKEAHIFTVFNLAVFDDWVGSYPRHANS